MSHDTYELKAEAREQVGKGSARAVRRNGKVPAVIYGDKQPPLAIALTYKDIYYKIHGGGFLTTIATIDVDGKKIQVLPKDFQLDPVKDFPVHVDFLRLAAGQTVKVLVPIHVIGQESSPGLKNGGAMQLVEHAVEIDVSPESIPDAFEVSVAGLEIGDSIHSDAIKLPEGASLTSRENLTLVTIVPPNVIEEPAATEEAPAADAKKA